MRYSFSFVPDSNDFSTFGKIIKQAESDGFDLAWTPDQGYMVDPFVALALAAGQSNRMRLGLGITSPFMRHPMQIARAAATLANLTDGRFVLGLGAGEKARIRVPVGAPDGRFLDVIDDTFTALRGLLDGQAVTIQNSAFTLHDTALEMRVARPVPIYLATTAPGAFRLAGARADGVIVGDVACPETMQEIVSWIAEGAREAGRDLADIDIVAWVATIASDDPAEFRERLRRRVVGTALCGMSKATRRLLGVKEQDIPQIQAARRDENAPLTWQAITDDMIDRVALVGDVSTIKHRIDALADAGVTTVSFRMPVALQDYVSFAQNIERLKRGVMPHIKN